MGEVLVVHENVLQLRAFEASFVSPFEVGDQVLGAQQCVGGFADSQPVFEDPQCLLGFLPEHLIPRLLISAKLLRGSFGIKVFVWVLRAVELLQGGHEVLLDLEVQLGLSQQGHRHLCHVGEEQWTHLRGQGGTYELRGA